MQTTRENADKMRLKRSGLHHRIRRANENVTVAFASSEFTKSASTARAALTLFAAQCTCMTLALIFKSRVNVDRLCECARWSSSSHILHAPINCEKSHMVSPLAHLMQSPTSRAYILYHLKIGMRTPLRFIRVLHVSSLSSFHTSYLGVSGVCGAHSTARMALYWKSQFNNNQNVFLSSFYIHFFSSSVSSS